MLQKIYERLLEEYGHQGWWPLISYDGTNPTKTGSIRGYHPKDYSYPMNEEQKFEIICGALLTQNTSWKNVEKALINLKERDILDPKKIISSKIEIIKELIKPAGYYNQKAERLKILAAFFISLNGKVPKREELLSLKGVGFETADSILLYAYSVPSFVIDAYTKRIFSKLGLINDKGTYNEIKDYFERSLKEDYKIYQEFHALIVEHAKRYYLKKRYEKDFLLDLI
jgi:endonuclease III related protein